MAFGGSMFGAGMFAGSEGESTPPVPGHGYIVDFPEFAGEIVDRPTPDHGRITDYPPSGGKVTDR